MDTDVAEVCAFGAAHIVPHYTPLLGVEAAESQQRNWWTPERIGASVAAGLVTIVEQHGRLVGVGERGTWDGEHVIWKLYVHPDRRGHGIGPKIIDALESQLPDNTPELYIEHFVANERAGTFYERVGFRVHRRVPSPTADAGLGTVWRVKTLPPHQ